MTELVVHAVEEIDGLRVTVGVAASPEALSLALQGGGFGLRGADIQDELREAIYRRLQSEVRLLLDEARPRLRVGLVEVSLQMLRGELDGADRGAGQGSGRCDTLPR